MSSCFRGLYINLEKSTFRREQCEAFLKAHGLSDYYQRFNGILGSDFAKQYKSSGLSAGKIGCWLSHLNAVKSSLNNDCHLHVLEDDFELTSAFPQFVRNFDKHTENLGDWDIIFTDFTLTINRDVGAIKQFIAKINKLQSNNRFVIEDAKHLYAAGNSSYIVNKSSKQKIADILEAGMGSPLPQDIYLREQARQGKIKILVTLPFLTTLSETFKESDILGKIDDRNPSIINNVIFRKSLSWGADTKELLKTIKQRISAQPPINDRAMIYTHLVAHIVSDEYKNF